MVMDGANPLRLLTDFLAVSSTNLFSIFRIMIKRPLNIRFSTPVREGQKFTTIRDNPWPVGKPIMLYNWSGAAYRSPQIDVAPVSVLGWWPIVIERQADGTMRYECGMENEKPLWECEGFLSQADMDEWFSAKMKRGEWLNKYLMRFRLLNAGSDAPGAND
jgi:hypothetical protein